MHIPDGFLSAPVWGTLDALSAPAVALVASRAQRSFEEHRVPLLGVMGAFVFAAQMINFPVGVGTSGHLVGGALLSYTLGPGAACIVMTAILGTQALVFQDGGLLALGANVMNMAIVGVFAGYWPYRMWGSGRWRRWALFLGGFASVMASAVLALSELLISGVQMPRTAMVVSLALFAVSAIIEGGITLAVVGSLETLQPTFIRQPAGERRTGVLLLAGTSVFLSLVGILFASVKPDGIENVLQGKPAVAGLFANYRASFIASDWVSRAVGGLIGLAAIYLLCLILGRVIANLRRTRSA